MAPVVRGIAAIGTALGEMVTTARLTTSLTTDTVRRSASRTAAVAISTADIAIVAHNSMVGAVVTGATVGKQQSSATMARGAGLHARSSAPLLVYCLKKTSRVHVVDTASFLPPPFGNAR